MPKQHLSEEDKEILEEMKEAGELEEEAGKENQEEEKEEEQEEKPVEKIEDKPEEQEEEQKPSDRPVKYMPLDKYQEQKSKWQEELSERDRKLQEQEQKLSTLQQKLEKENTTTSLKSLADKYSVDVELLSDLATAIKAEVATPQSVLDKVAQIEENAKLLEQKNQFESEFQSLDIKAKYPNAPANNIAEVKSKLDELAHSERFNRYPLQDILALNPELQELLQPVEVKKTLESKRNKTANQQEVSAQEKLENIDDLSDKEFDELMEELSKGQNRLTVNK